MLLRVAGVVAIFLIGFGLGSAFQDNRGGAGTQTLIRTLDPLPLEPAARETVTVTVTTP